MKNFSSKIVLLLLSLLTGWVYAADSSLSNGFVKLSEEEAIKFARAICSSRIAKDSSCEYGQGSFSLFINFARGNFGLGSVIYGSFTFPNLKEAFVDLIVYEGEFNRASALFQYRENEWNLIDFNPNQGAYNCSKFNNINYQDFLVCGSTWFDFGFDFGAKKDDASVYAEFNSFFDLQTFRFENGTIEVEYLFNFVNPSYVFCDELNQERSGKDYLGDFSWSHNDINNDLNPDLLLDFRQAKIDSSTCFNLGKGFSNPEAIHPVQLIWLFDGETFTPTPETQVFLDNFPKQ
jgi:hypothetical protein